MTIQSPTRIVIEIHPAPVIDSAPRATQPVVTVSQRDDSALPAPTPYEPGPCTCLDDEDCGADHGND